VNGDKWTVNDDFVETLQPLPTPVRAFILRSIDAVIICEELMNKYLSILLVMAALAVDSYAQGTSGVIESTDPAKAAAVERAAAALKADQASGSASAPAQGSAMVVRGQSENGVAYLSGGVSVDDQTAMYAERGRYSLWVATVAKGSGAYLSDARLRIVALGDKRVVLEHTMDGPWLFAALPPGRYEITATMPADGPDAAQTLTSRVSIVRGTQRQAVLRFASSANVSPERNNPFKGNPFGGPPSAN
jgi:hypothetical protein